MSEVPLYLSENSEQAGLPSPSPAPIEAGFRHLPPKACAAPIPVAIRLCTVLPHGAYFVTRLICLFGLRGVEC